jgi:hypothetical protein
MLPSAIGNIGNGALPQPAAPDWKSLKSAWLEPHGVAPTIMVAVGQTLPPVVTFAESSENASLDATATASR